jgi:hypothetical protein
MGDRRDLEQAVARLQTQLSRLERHPQPDIRHRSSYYYDRAVAAVEAVVRDLDQLTRARSR